MSKFEGFDLEIADAFLEQASGNEDVTERVSDIQAAAAHAAIAHAEAAVRQAEALERIANRLDSLTGEYGLMIQNIHSHDL